MKARAWWVPVIASLFVAGCGPTVSGVCDSLDDECPDYIPLEECEDEGHRIEDLAESQGCDRAFENYLECIDAELCDWSDSCTEIRLELDVCLDDASL